MSRAGLVLVHTSPQSDAAIRTRIIVVTVVLSVLIGASNSTPATATTDLWIWRDRWNQMGRGFKMGYVVAVKDLVSYLSSLVVLPKPGGPTTADAIRAAHLGMGDNYPTVKSALDWTNDLVAKEQEPFVMVAAMIFDGLRSLGSGTFTEEGFVWKDHWAADKWPELFLDGYVAAVFDLIRSLDNAGKTQMVLDLDIVTAALANSRFKTRTKHTNVSVGDVIGMVTPMLQRSSDPGDNMALVIFDALRTYK